jgi:hypothetical protein
MAAVETPAQKGVTYPEQGLASLYTLVGAEQDPRTRLPCLLACVSAEAAMSWAAAAATKSTNAALESVAVDGLAALKIIKHCAGA